MRKEQVSSGRGANRKRLILTLAPAVAVVVVFVVMAVVYLVGEKTIYDAILRFWGVKPYKFPFLDTETIFSALRCKRAGIDIFVNNPCDPKGRLFDYSPLWLVLAVLPVTKAWTNVAGLIFDSLFLASLFFIPAGRTVRDAGLIALAMISTPVAFALERGNCDLVIFALAVLAAALLSRNDRLRFYGYGFATLAGLLKYYPLTLTSLATRERTKPFLVTVAAVVVVVGGLAYIGRDELRQALALIPVGTPFRDMFGAINLPLGFAKLFTNDGVPHWQVRMAEFTLAAVVLVAAALRGMAPERGEELSNLTETERTFLFVGSILLLSCFFAAQNIGYRAINLILVVPGLIALGARSADGGVYRMATSIVLILLWSEAIRRWVSYFAHSTVVPAYLWFLRECFWWITVFVLAQIATALFLQSEMVARVAEFIGLNSRNDLKSMDASQSSGEAI